MAGSRTPGRRAAFALALIVLGGCAERFTEEGLREVAAVSEARLGKPVAWQRDAAAREAARARMQSLLAAPLDAEAAVELALLNNRGLQASLAEIGIAAADRAAATRPPNPGFTFARTSTGGVREIERSITGDVLGLLVWPVAAGIEARRFEETKWRIAADVLHVAAAARKAWIEAVAAGEAASYMAQAQAAAEAQAALARSMAAVGNFAALDHAREQVFYAETTAALARARLQAQAARERLARRLGLWGAELGFALPGRLPDLPASPFTGEGFEQRVIAERLDIRRARAEIDGLQTALGLTRTTRFVNVLEASYLRNRTEGEPRETGYEIHLEVPIFDFGSARVAKAEAIHAQAVDRLAEIAVDARSQARSAYHAYRTAYDLARHWQDEVVPVRQRISAELVLRYNGMLISVFELLADAREQIASVVATIEARRDFWLAAADLDFVPYIAMTE